MTVANDNQPLDNFKRFEIGVASVLEEYKGQTLTGRLMETIIARLNGIVVATLGEMAEHIDVKWGRNPSNLSEVEMMLEPIDEAGLEFLRMVQAAKQEMA